MMTFSIISLFVLFVSFILFKRVAGSLSLFKPNMISYVFYFNILIQMFMAVILAVNGIDGHYIISSVGFDTKLLAWMAVMYLMISLPVGMLIAKSILIRRTSMSQLLNLYVHNGINVSGSYGKATKYSVWFFTCVSITACLYTLWQVGYFPFIKIFNASHAELAVIRISVSRDFPGNMYIKNIFALTMMPILSYMWFFYYSESKKASDLVMFFIALFFSLSILYYNFEKGPILWYLLSFIFAYFYSHGALKVSYVLPICIIVMLAIVMLYILSGSHLQDFYNYNSGPIGRIILSQAGGLFIMLDIFPKHYDFIGLSSISQLINNAFGFHSMDRAARIAMQYFNPRGVEDGVSGVMNSIFIAEAWANFGLLGVLLSPFWVGFLLQCLYVFFLKAPKNPVFLAFFVRFSLFGSVTGGFNEYIYNPNVFSMIVLYLSIFFVAMIFRYSLVKAS